MKSSLNRKRVVSVLKIMGRSLAYIRPYKKDFAIILFCAALIMGFNLWSIYLLKPFTDEVFAPIVPASPDQRVRALRDLTLLLIFVFLLQTTVSTFLAFFRKKFGEKIGTSIRSDLFRYVQKLPMRYYNRENVGGIHSRIFYDVVSIQYFLANDLEGLFSSVIMAVGTALILLQLNITLSILVLFPMPFIFVFEYFIRERSDRFFQDTHRKMANLSAFVFNSIAGILNVKINTTEEMELKRFAVASDALFFSKMKVEKFVTFVAPAVAIFLFVSQIMVRWFGGLKVITASLSLGELMVFLGFTLQFGATLQNLTAIFPRFMSSIVAARRVFELSDETPETTATLIRKVVPVEIKGGIRFENVSFSYDRDKKVLSGINLEINPGEIIGITGPSGSGKSTLISLIARLYEISSGALYVDGYDIRNFDLNELRGQIGIVLQETMLFPGTIADNIAYARSDAPAERIIGAAKAACAHDFIMRLPDAYDTVLGERGVGLSGGEKQRISIARVLVKNPQIIIFDEPTSSVDLETEYFIQETIEKLAKSHTVIIISHRLTLLNKTDKVVVLVGGRIEECCHFDSLQKSVKYLRRFLEVK